MLCCITHVMSCYVINICHVMSCYITYVMSCYITYVMLYNMFCYVI